MITIDTTTSKKKLQDFLRAKGWLYDAERLESVEKPGEGNMNVLLRVRTGNRSFILKQSRPYVHKYPEVKAPLERIDVEFRFYRALQGQEVEHHFPRIIAYDPSNYLLQLEDLADCEDMTCLYDQRSISTEIRQKLIAILGSIHHTEVPVDYPENAALRQLNHQHIFVLPFLEDNGFSLDEVQKGLQDLAAPFKKDSDVLSVVKRIGHHYLGKGEVLLHGDYFPGSWMIRGEKVYVIDPEFSFAGFAEFDLGVMAAHLLMATMDESSLHSVEREYLGETDAPLILQVAGIEVVRRIIGLAQLPLERSLEEKQYLLQTARKLILQ